MQLQAGYIFDFIKDELFENHNNSDVTALLKDLSFFETSGCNFDTIDNTKPELAVLYNLLSKGLPTRSSLFVEESFLNTFKIGKTETDGLGNIQTIPNISFENISSYLFRALHIVDPRINSANSICDYDYGSDYERDFHKKFLAKYIGEEWFQLIESQRKFTSIKNDDSAFTQQNVDFSIQFPYKIDDKNGIVIEIDGSHHWEDTKQTILDGQRDKAVIDSGWLNTLRIQTRNFGNIQNQLNRLQKISEQDYFNTIKINYNNPLYKSDLGITAIQFVLSHFSIARLQKVIIYSILSNKLNLHTKTWKIAVIERDVPCAVLALVDLQEQLNNIYALKDETISPEIDLTVFVTPEFKTAEINKQVFTSHFSNITFIDLDKATANIEFDMLFDISVLQRNGFSENNAFIPAKHKVVVRSSHHQHTTRQFLTSEVISYASFITPNTQIPHQTTIEFDKKLLLEYFLQNIFRKQSFRAGQLEILNKALQGQSVIGLLPTGGGKSLTYQLSSLLQPGICLVIDPIKSLMKDQIDNLRRNQIDACNFINSSLRTREAKEKEISKLKNGEVLFCFVSPERLQMEEFRETLSAMYDNHIYFNYCVIDEVHCVSEWGHDFRTSYLSLGKNAIKFCRTKNKKTIPLFGLTATASFDVLSDVQRELSGKNNDEERLNEDSVIRFDTVNRPELNYKIIDVHADLNNINHHGRNFEWELKRTLGEAKQEKLLSMLVNSSSNWDSENLVSGIIFCPHRKGYFGVTDRYKVTPTNTAIYDVIKNANIDNMRIGSFMGSDADNESISERIEADSNQAQEDFVNNKLNLLVSTKAFGMGIDKPNVRFTLHINYPSSIESFVQEAGRAGRDKKSARCLILFNDEKVSNGTKNYEIDRDNLLFFHNSSFKGADKESAIINELLTQINSPDKTSEIEQIILAELETVVNCKIKKNPNWVRLYIDGDYPNTYGYLDLLTLNVHTNFATYDSELSQTICQIAKEFITTNCKNSNWLNWIEEKSTEDGIEKRLTEISVGEKIFPDIVLKFSNDSPTHFDKITRALHNWDNRFDNDIVLSAKSGTTKFVDFIEKLEENFLRKTNTTINITALLPSDVFLKFKNFYNSYREKSDTEKALYRLSTIGIIDDYTVDFKVNTYTLYATRKSDEQYFKNLENYIRKYYSEVRTKAEIKKAEKFEGDTAIQKCLNFLTDFVYREIEKKRFEGIGAMKEACSVGKEKGDEEFKEFIDLYFNSKYARKNYEINGINKSLTDRTDEGQKQNINWVWEFIEIIDVDNTGGGQINNLKHLRGACIKLLIPQPDNACFHLLKAFSIFILEPDNKRLMEEASNSFAKGFIGFQKEKDWSFEKLLSEADKFKKYVLQFSFHANIQEIMENNIANLSIEIHSEWLADFNNKFLKNL
jgi:ATP-dependent DNA helicase RecQ